MRFLGKLLVGLPPVRNIKNTVCLQCSYTSGRDCPQSLLNNLCDWTKTVTGGLSLHYWLVACPCVPCNSSSSARYPRQFINSSPSMLGRNLVEMINITITLILRGISPAWFPEPELLTRGSAHTVLSGHRGQRAASCCMWQKSCMQEKCSANTAGKGLEGQELVCSFVSLFLEINLGRILDENLRVWEAFTGKSSLEFRMIGRTILHG